MSAANIGQLLSTLEMNEKSSTSLGPLRYFQAKEFIASINERLGLEGFSIAIGKQFWLAENEQLEQEKAIAITTHPVAGEVRWFLENASTVKLLSWMLQEEEKKALSSQNFVEGFYHYVLLEMLDALTTTPLFSRIAPKLTMHPTSNDPLFAIEVSFLYQKQAVTGLLFLSSTFLESFQEHFVIWESSLPVASLYPDVTVLANLTIGNVELPIKTLQESRLQDVLLLDTTHYNLKEKKGVAFAKVGCNTLFKARLENGQAHIISFNPPEKIMESDNEQPEETATSKPNFDDLSLSVDVDLGAVEFSLKELQDLRANSCFPLADNPSHLVSLRVQGKKIGTGELVALGDNFGVRILSIDYTK